MRELLAQVFSRLRQRKNDDEDGIWARQEVQRVQGLAGFISGIIPDRKGSFARIDSSARARNARQSHSFHLDAPSGLLTESVGQARRVAGNRSDISPFADGTGKQADRFLVLL